jgi:tetratricopeptide (TPR) repeat protein
MRAQGAGVAPGCPVSRWNRSSLFLLIAICLSLPRSSLSQPGGYAQAESLVRNHEWDDGLAVVLQLLKSDPRNTKDLNLAGLALTGKGDIAKADEYFKKALLVSPGFVPALKNLAINEFNQKQYDAAQKHLLAAVKEAPGDPVVRLYLGEIAYREHKYQSAVEEFGGASDLVFRNPNAAAHLVVSYLQINEQQKALDILDKLAPEQIEPQSQFALGLTLQQLGLVARSIPYLEAVHLRDPDAYDIGFDLVLAYIEVKEFPKAIDEARDLILHGHETSELNNLLAEAYEGNNEIQHAVDALRRAIALDPADEENYLDFASLCMNQRSLQAGMQVIQVGLESHPKSDRLIFMRGVLYAMQDEFEKAESDFKRSAELAPQTNLGYVGLGVSYLETGHDAQAIEILHRRLRENPNDASLLYLLGEALLRTGAAPGTPAYVEAQTSLEKSVRLNPNLCLPHVSLGTIYLDEDRPKDAVEQFEKARAIDPKERSAYSHLAVAYRRLGQADKSKEVLNALKDVIGQERQSTREKMKTAPGAASDDGSQEKLP